MYMGFMYRTIRNMFREDPNQKRREMLEEQKHYVEPLSDRDADFTHYGVHYLYFLLKYPLHILALTFAVVAPIVLFVWYFNIIGHTVHIAKAFWNLIITL